MLFPLSQQHFAERSPPLLRLQRFHSSIPFTWTWLIPEDDHSQHGSLSFNWSLWDQIAGSSCNINGWRLPLTSPGAHWSPRWQPDGINPPHQAVLQFIKDLIWPFSAEESLTTMLERLVKRTGQAITRARCSKRHQNT